MNKNGSFSFIQIKKKHQENFNEGLKKTADLQSDPEVAKTIH